MYFQIYNEILKYLNISSRVFLHKNFCNIPDFSNHDKKMMIEDKNIGVDENLFKAIWETSSILSGSYLLQKITNTSKWKSNDIDLYCWETSSTLIPYKLFDWLVENCTYVSNYRNSPVNDNSCEYLKSIETTMPVKIKKVKNYIHKISGCRFQIILMGTDITKITTYKDREKRDILKDYCKGFDLSCLINTFDGKELIIQDIESIYTSQTTLCNVNSKSSVCSRWCHIGHKQNFNIDITLERCHKYSERGFAIKFKNDILDLSNSNNCLKIILNS